MHSSPDASFSKESTMQRKEAAFDTKSRLASVLDKKLPACPSKPIPLDEKTLREVVGGTLPVKRFSPNPNW
jgi:hypothetical protein